MHETGLRLPVPMRDQKAFLRMLQLDLNGRPPAAPVVKVYLAAEPVKPQTDAAWVVYAVIAGAGKAGIDGGAGEASGGAGPGGDAGDFEYAQAGCFYDAGVCAASGGECGRG